MSFLCCPVRTLFTVHAFSIHENLKVSLRTNLPVQDQAGDVSVSNSCSCVEHFRYKFNLPHNPDSLFVYVFLPPIPFSFSSAVFSSVARLPPLHGPRLMFHFQTTVASHCFISVLSLSLSSMYWETATQQREAKTQWPGWHIRGGGIWEAEASVALKWERTSLISNLKLPCSHLWPALNSLTQAIHRLFSHTKTSVFTQHHA